MQAFKPRSKGGLGIGSTPDAIKPDGIEQKFIAIGKSKKGLSKSDLSTQAEALANAAAVTKAIGEVTIHYADKDGKKNPTKWKQYVTEMQKAATDFLPRPRRATGRGSRRRWARSTTGCINCHSDFRD